MAATAILAIVAAVASTASMVFSVLTARRLRRARRLPEVRVDVKAPPDVRDQVKWARAYIEDHYGDLR